MKLYDHDNNKNQDDKLKCSDLSKILNLCKHSCIKNKCRAKRSTNKLFRLSLKDEEDLTLLMKAFILVKYGASDMERPSTRSLVREAFQFYHQKNYVLICNSYLKTKKKNIGYGFRCCVHHCTSGHLRTLQILNHH